MHDFLERSGLPILIVILVPLGLIAFGLWSAYSGASPQPASPAQAQVQQAPGTPGPAALSLDASSTLPTSVAVGDFASFSFTIGNPGSAAATYQYKVSVKWSTGEEDVIDENVAEVPAGGSQTIAESLKFEVADETAQVSITLPQTGQSLQFSLPRTD